MFGFRWPILFANDYAISHAIYPLASNNSHAFHNVGMTAVPVAPSLHAIAMRISNTSPATNDVSVIVKSKSAAVRLLIDWAAVAHKSDDAAALSPSSYTWASIVQEVSASAMLDPV